MLELETASDLRRAESRWKSVGSMRRSVYKTGLGSPHPTQAAIVLRVEANAGELHTLL